MKYKSRPKTKLTKFEGARKRDAVAPAMPIKLPKEYSKLRDSDFPIVIGGIKYKTKQELADRYEADLMAFTKLIYDIYREDKAKSIN